MTHTPKILVLHGGGRPGGNTETLTKFAVANLPVTEYYLRDYDIKEIIDQRHDDGGFTPVQDDFDEIFADALTHDIWIFSTPLHWYSMAVPLKRFVDRWSQAVREPTFEYAKARFPEITAHLITVGGDDPKVAALPLVQQFERICRFVNMQYGGYIIGDANLPESIVNDRAAMALAAELRGCLRGATSMMKSETNEGRY